MFDRPYIKQIAKNRMSGWMGNAILVGLIALLLGGMTNGSLPKFQFKFLTKGTQDNNILFDYFLHFMPLIATLSIAGIVYTILVANVIKIGTHGWFLRYWRGQYPSVGELFAGFKIYTPCVTTGLLRSVYVFLWSLLLIIPGIIMGYAYSMSDYIIYENPNLPASRAIEMSRQMTMGYKGELFVFDLSYIGWGLLSALTCGILGIVYVNPYKLTAHAGIYEVLKDSALRRGILHYEDFGMMPPPPTDNGGYQTTAI